MTKEKENKIPTIEKKYYIHDQKRYVSFTAPDVKKMKEVIIDGKTKLYIAADASVEDARKRYFEKMNTKK